MNTFTWVTHQPRKEIWPAQLALARATRELARDAIMAIINGANLQYPLNPKPHPSTFSIEKLESWEPK